MSTGQERKLYVDFARSGGVVESSPNRVLPELVFTGKTRSQLDIELEHHARMVQEILGQSAWKVASLGKAVQVAKPLFLGLSLAEPGIVEVTDNFHTGWFYTSEGGRKYVAFRKKDSLLLSPYAYQANRKPYFLLDKTEAESWNERIKQNPLTIEEVDELFLSPGLDVHPSYEGLSRSNLKVLTDKAASTTDSFWTTFKSFDSKDKSDTKREFLRNNLLDLEILSGFLFASQRKALAEVSESMEKSEITVFPLGQERCAVTYITHVGNGQTKIRTLPLPHNLMRLFQRYGRLGERPMTKTEFEAQYRRLVDPNTKLSF